MNNKGFTVVELIVSFVLVMTISLGLFKVVDSYREKQQQQLYKKITKAYANEILTKIQTDVIDGGGIISAIRLDGLVDSFDDESNIQRKNLCHNYSQGVVFRVRQQDDNKYMLLCIGNGVLNSEKNGILYGEITFNGSNFNPSKNDTIFYEKPSVFIEILDYVLINESSTFDYNGSINKKIWNISMKIKHSEVNEIFDINIVSPQAVN